MTKQKPPGSFCLENPMPSGIGFFNSCHSREGGNLAFDILDPGSLAGMTIRNKDH